MYRVQLLVLVVALGIALAWPSGASAAGMTTHAWMAEVALKHVRDPQLRSLLVRHRPALLSGAAYPDSGYAVSSYPGGDYGEISHWERFINAYAARIRSKPSCRRTIARGSGRCAPQIAHMMGAAAHGMGDEVWDWLFEPQMHDHGEDPSHRSRIDDQPGWAELALTPFGPAIGQSLLDLEQGLLGATPAGALTGSPEYAMDVIAIADHRRLLYSPVPPPVEDLLAVYRAIGRPDVTRDGILAGHGAVTAIQGAQRVSALEADSVRRDMPHSSAHMHDESGGVEYTAKAIAPYYEALWAKLGGERPRPRVAAVHPEPGEQGVSYVFQPPRTSPGPRGGGAANRIVAVLSNAVDPASVSGAGFLLRDQRGRRVALLAGTPRPGPYHAGDGTHSILLHPAADLQPCATYTAVLTTRLRDLAGRSLPRSSSWSFRTRAAPGKRCSAQPRRNGRRGGRKQATRP